MMLNELRQLELRCDANEIVQTLDNDLLGIPDTSLSGLNTLAALRAFKLPALIPSWSSGKLINLAKIRNTLLIAGVTVKWCTDEKPANKAFKHSYSTIQQRIKFQKTTAANCSWITQT